MTEKFKVRFLLIILVLILTTKSYSQALGDFQTKNSTGNWSDFNAWNIYNGSWVAATTGQIPTATSNVFVQLAQTINVDDATAVCNNLDFLMYGNTSSKVAFSSAIAVLNVKGNLVLNSTTHNCFGTWTTGGKIAFSGTGAQIFTNLSANAVFVNIEVNKSAGSLTTSSNVRFGQFTLTSGNFIVGPGFEMQGSSSASTINVNGGVWTQIASTTRIYSILPTNPSPLSALNINSGLMILQTSTGTTGFAFSSINITNGGVLTLNHFGGSGIISINSSISVDATSTFNSALASTPLPASVTFNGVVNYNYSGPQDISQATYSYLKLSGSGLKTLAAGTTTIPANGTLEMSGGATSPTFSSGTGTLSVSNSATNLLYTSTGMQAAGSGEWDPNFQNITINNAAGVGMGGLSRAILGSLNLINGTLNVGVSGALTLDGAALNRTNGYISGTSASDLTITGTTGGSVLLPLSADINLRNITVSGTRTVQMDGTNNINLYGSFSVGANATYDNGGESIINRGGGTPTVNIDGRFITRDAQGLYYYNTTPTVFGAINANNVAAPVLGSRSTVEYGFSGDQLVQGSTVNYSNVTFSGSGVKTLASPTAPKGTVYITGNATFQAGIHTFGDNGTAPFTNFTMDGGRLIMSGTNNPQPQMSGTYNLSGGVVEFACPSVSGQTIRNQTYFGIEVTGAYVGNSSGNINLAPDGFFTVKSGGVFTINADQVTGATGSQTVTVDSGAIFKCGSADGFSGGNGSIGNSTAIKSDIETMVLAGGSLVDYSRNNIQKITNQIPYQNLSISGTGIKTAPSGTLVVQGNLIKSGTSTFAHNSGTVLLNGADQTFAGLTFYELQLANGVKQTSGSSAIIDSIKINDGAAMSISNGDIVTLHSDAIKTGRLGQLGTGAINYNTSGRFVIERYISGHRAWRFLSVPVTSQTIQGAWQENGATGPAVTGMGTQITGPQGLAGGFDLYSALPSLKTYNPATNDYDAVTATTVPFDVSKGGYLLFVRGDRNTTYPATSATTLRTSGQLFTGSQGAVSVGNQFTPVNNPYASQIDMVKLTPDGITYPAFYVWDPNLGGTYGYGAFVTFVWNPATSHFDITNGGGSYADGDHIIDNGQAFLVSTLGTGFSIPVTENVKTDVALLGGGTPFTPVTRPGQQLRTLLYTTGQDGNYYMADGVLNNYGDNFSNNIDGMDAQKYLNTAENLSVVRGGVLLSIERRQTLRTQDTIFFRLNNLKPTGTYRLVFVPAKIEESSLQPGLEDGYLHTTTLLRLNDSTQVNFITDGSAASIAPDRFRIVFQAAEGPLPLMVTSVKAYTKNQGIAVEWNVENETGMKSYQLEKSADGTSYLSLSEVVTVNNGRSGNYSWLDGQPLAGYNYYRIKMMAINTQIHYSKVVKVWEGDLRTGISVYPNPVAKGQIHLLFNNQPAGKYAIRLINKWGQVVSSKQVQYTGVGRSSEEIPMDEYAAHGLYRLEIIKPGGECENINVVY